MAHKTLRIKNPGRSTHKESTLAGASLLLLVAQVVMAEPTERTLKNLPLVFDPQTKKYFIGGNTKFTLKEGDASSLIERIEISVDGGEYRSYDEAVKFDHEGKHSLKFRAVNPVNNWSPTQFVEVFVDLTAPTSEAKFSEERFHKGQDAIYVAQGSQISLASQDNLSGVQTIDYSWDGQTFSPYVKPIQIEKTGPQTLYYRSVDRVGNMEKVQKLELICDKAAPTTKVALQGIDKPALVNGKNYVSDSVAFALQSDDDASGIKQVWVEIDGKPSLYIKPIYFLDEGPHTLSYYSIDRVGNREEKRTFALHTISTPPKTKVIPVGKSVDTGGINYALPGYSLKLEAEESVVGIDRIEYKFQGDGEFRPYLEPIHFRSVGMHSVSFRAVDRAGNIEPAKTYNVHVLESAPETAISTAQPLVVREGVVYSPAPNILTLNVGNSPVGISKTLISVNDGPFEVYQGPLTLTSDRRIYKISYKSVDKLGNEEAPKTVTYSMIGAIPIVDLFVSSGTNSEEQLRTHYIESNQQPKEAPTATEMNSEAGRGLASESR